MNQTPQTIRVFGLGRVNYEFLGRLSASALNQALTDNTIPISKDQKTNIYTAFNELVDGKQAALPFNEKLGANNPVDFYRLTYNTKIPENNKTYKVSGLLALPVLPANIGSRRQSVPLMSWQHGTILSADDAPSELIRNGAVVRSAYGVPASAETLFNSVRFAGNGYALAAADYIGNGTSTETQAFEIKGATVKTTRDMITGASAVIKQLAPSYNLTPHNPISQLVLNGWSMGGLNTAWLGNALQNDGITVHKQAQSAGPIDLAKTLTYWLNDYPGSPNWLTACVPLLIGAYEKFYGIKDLMRQAIHSDYLDTAYKIYNKQINWNEVPTPAAGKGLLGLPLTPKAMMNPQFLEEFNAGRGQFYEQLKRNSGLEVAYTWPTRFYGGAGDNVSPPAFSVDQPVRFQESLGSSLSDGIDFGTAATHRSTFLSSLFGALNNPTSDILTWLNG